MSSSQRMSHKILGGGTETAAENFFCDLANSVVDDALAQKLSRKYPELAKSIGSSLEALTWLQGYLQRAWNAADNRTREWYLFELRRQYRDSAVVMSFRKQPDPRGGVFSLVPGFGMDVTRVDQRLIDPPPPTAFEGAVYYFQHAIGNLAKHCRHVDCPAPYFIAEKGWQQFCSEKCAGQGTRESKRRWWHKNKAKKGSL